MENKPIGLESAAVWLGSTSFGSGRAFGCQAQLAALEQDWAIPIAHLRQKGATAVPEQNLPIEDDEALQPLVRGVVAIPDDHLARGSKNTACILDPDRARAITQPRRFNNMGGSHFWASLSRTTGG